MIKYTFTMHITTRGLKEEDMKVIVDMIDRFLVIPIRLGTPFLKNIL